MGDMQFSTQEEELLFWRSKAEEYKQILEETREELEEFQISSRELELELETQLEQSEKKNKDLRSVNDKLQLENETLKNRVDNNQEYLNRQFTQIQEDYRRVTQEKDELRKYVRELEQVNDDLERAKRATVVSLEDFEGKMNHAIERNAFLENELDEKEALLVTVQRLKDEARDLRQEVEVRNSKHEQSFLDMNGLQSIVSSSCQTDPIDSNRLTESPISFNHNPYTPVIRSLSNGKYGSGNPLTPSVRISALNLVGDLLRKVGALESKLASCRTYADTNGTCIPPSTIRRPNGIQAVSPAIISPTNGTRSKQLIQ